MSTATLHIEKKKTSVPQLRFQEFDEEWKQTKLGNVCEKIQDGNYGGEYPKADEFVEKGIPFLTSKALGGDGFLKEGKIDFIPTEKHNKLKKAQLKLNDVLFTNRGSNVGCIGFTDIRIAHGNIGPQLTLLRSDLKIIIPFFLYQIMKSEITVKQIRSQDSGSAMNFFGIDTTSKFKLSIPTIPEQQKIASFLSAVDEKIQQLSRKKELLSQYKKGVMQQLFSGKLRFKDENGKDYADWEEKKLGDIGETYNGLTGKTKEDFGIGKPYVQYKQIFDNSRIDISRFELVNIGDDEKQKKVMFGDVFFTVSSETPNEIGTASVLLDQIDELYLNSFCFGYRANSLELLSPYFSRYLFRSELFRNEIVKLAQGSTRYNMSKVQLMKLVIQLPCFEEQKKIANFLSSIDTKIESTNQQINQTQSFKKGLLQQLFV